MAVNVFKRTNVIAQKATTDYTVNFVSPKEALRWLTNRNQFRKIFSSLFDCSKMRHSVHEWWQMYWQQ